MEAFDASRHRIFLVSGTQWGDECKGKLVADLSANVDIVAKYNGGHNSGHEVVHQGTTHKFHVLPCSVFREGVVNVLGNGVVVHLQSLLGEIQTLRDKGIEILDRLLISTRAQLIFEVHRLMDHELEQRRSDDSKSKLGTTLRGIGPCYATRCMRTGVSVGDMLHWDAFESKVRHLFKAHCSAPDALARAEEEIERHKAHFAQLSRCLVDTEDYMAEAIEQGKRILIEGANGSLLDLVLGTYPFVTSSNTLTCGAYSGLGIAPDVPIFRIGVLKCYQTRVGPGPFPTELFDEAYAHMQGVGKEFGVTTGRTRRCGWLDLPAARYVQRINRFHCLNFTKLDVLSGLPTIKVCTDYRHRRSGEMLKRGTFPSTAEAFEHWEPVYCELEGWSQDISGVREYHQLPAQTRRLVQLVQEDLGVFIQWLGVGKDVSATITRRPDH